MDAPQYPTEPTPLCGRADDLTALRQLSRERRLVAITGPPGVGKSRVALALAREEAAWFCDLAPASDAESLLGHVARALGMNASGADVGAALKSRLDDLGDITLVLDNAEQVADAVAEHVAAWLDAAPAARFVVASRERLRLDGEVIYELEPLVEEQGVALLLARLRDTRPDYTPDDEARAQLTAIARELEGLPLAIELAAARADALGLAGLLERLSQRLTLLSRSRKRKQRSATLEGALELSWQLLDEGQRLAFARVSVFRSSFDVPAAEAVIGEDALDLLQDLRERSLLRQPAPGRFAMFESIRVFAATKLSEEDAAATKERHRDHFLAFGEQQLEVFKSRGGAVDELARERDNLRAAFEHSLERGAAEPAARLLLALAPVLAAEGPASTHLALVDRARALLDDDPRLLFERALALRILGDMDGCERDLLASLELCDPDEWLYAVARKELGVTHHARRAIDAARACYEAALAAARTLADQRLEALLIGNLGALAHDTGRFEEAAESYHQALELLRAVGDTRKEGLYLMNLGILEQEEGRHARASKHYRRALTLAEEAGDRRYQAIVLGSLGVLAHETGDADAALALHERALTLLLQVGDAYSQALCRARIAAALTATAATEGGAEILARAEAELDHAERLMATKADTAAEVVRLHRCFLELASGEESAAYARLEAAQAPRDGGPSLVEVNDDARLVLRMLAKGLSDGPRLEVGQEARWFLPPGGSRQSLEKHAAARRMLEHLTQRRLSAPGAATSSDDLFAAGWPGVQIKAQSASNRLYVTLAKLRKLGLKSLLLRNDDGYLLDPATPLLRVDE